MVITMSVRVSFTETMGPCHVAHLIYKDGYNECMGEPVAEWLARLTPMRENRVRAPAGARTFSLV
jgi:hypothetical protein